MAFIGAIVGGTLVGTALTPEQPRTHYYDRADQSTKTESAQPRQHSSLWVPQDSVGFYALWTAIFTGVLAFSTIALWSETGLASERQVAEWRRIGEAQVRAYVNITAATIVFAPFAEGIVPAPPDDVQPFIKITAKNNGQSPAKNFVWNPTIECFGMGEGTKSITRELGGNWRKIRGIGIAATDEHSDGAILPLLLMKFLRENRSNQRFVLVRLRIQFEFEDVFDVKISDETFFSGGFIRTPGEVHPTNVGNTEWTGKLSRVSKPNDWPADS